MALVPLVIASSASFEQNQDTIPAGFQGVGQSLEHPDFLPDTACGASACTASPMCEVASGVGPLAPSGTTCNSFDAAHSNAVTLQAPGALTCHALPVREVVGGVGASSTDHPTFDSEAAASSVFSSVRTPAASNDAVPVRTPGASACPAFPVREVDSGYCASSGNSEAVDPQVVVAASAPPRTVAAAACNIVVLHKTPQATFGET